MRKVDMSPEQYERHLAWNREYRRRNREKVNAANRRWRAQNRDKVAEYWQRYKHSEANTKKRSKPAARPAGETLKRALSFDPIFAVADAAVSRSYPDHARDDIIQSIALAVLEGEFSEREIAANVSRFASAYWSAREFFQTVSLDALMPGSSARTYHDIIAA